MSPEAPRGMLLVLSAPTGGGKTTIARRLVAKDAAACFSISHTTRAPRPGETDGVDYHFVDPESFRAMVSRGEFLEWAEVHGHLYGTHRSEAAAADAKGVALVLDIDVQGGLQIKRAEPSAVLVFILPPSLEVLLDRLGRRVGEPGFDLVRRLETAVKELELAGAYDYNVINEDLDTAVEQVQRILEASRMRPANHSERARALSRAITTWLRSQDVHRQ